MSPRPGSQFFRKCTAADCDHMVHVRAKECPSCGAAQNRVAAPDTAGPASPSVGTTEQAAPHVSVTAMPSLQPSASVTVDAPPYSGPYVVAADCRPQLDNVMAVLKHGTVISDYRMIQQLLAVGAPIVPENLAHGLACCPRCQTVFKPEPFVPANKRRAG